MPHPHSSSDICSSSISGASACLPKQAECFRGERHERQDRHHVDATIIAAPSSTKNAERARKAEMHQTRKDQQCYFGMKRPLGVDSYSGLAHSAMVTPANVHDKHALLQLLHGQEKQMYGDNAYRGQKALTRAKAPQAKELTSERVRCRKDEPADDIRRAKKPYQIKSVSQGRACVCRGQATVGLHEGGLSRVGHEGQPCLHATGICQSQPGARPANGRGAPAIGPKGP